MPRYSSTFPSHVVSGISCPSLLLSLSSMLSTMSLLTCDMFRSSTCNMIEHCFHSMSLFATHLSYWVIVKPHSCNLSDNSFQRSSAACEVPYMAFKAVHITLVFHVCCSIYVSCILLGLLLQSFMPLCLLTTCAHCHKYLHVEMRLVCQILLHIYFLWRLLHMVTSWLLLIL